MTRSGPPPKCWVWNFPHFFFDGFPKCLLILHPFKQTMENIEINLFYGAWHTKSILLFFRNRRINAYCRDMWKWHIRSHRMWHSTDQSIQWPPARPWRDREVIQRIQYQIHNVRLSLFSISGYIKDKTDSVLCFVTFLMGGNASWYKWWSSIKKTKHDIISKL